MVTGAHPTISVDDLTTSTMTMKVPIAVMEGVAEGAADLHYGNNVNLMSGHHVKVTVTLNGQKAVFHGGRARSPDAAAAEASS